MKGIYLGARNARHINFNLDYNDINNKYDCNIIADMMKIDLNKYDFFIATPPCNFWSRANYRFKNSKYALDTMNLLPGILDKLSKTQKPFIVENVRNNKRMEEYGIFKICNKNSIFYQYVGRHIYFTNQLINLSMIQKNDFKGRGKTFKRINNDIDRQGGFNVFEVVEFWLNSIVPGAKLKKI